MFMNDDIFRLAKMSRSRSTASTFYPELGISMPAGQSQARSTGIPVFTTRAEEKRREADMANKKYTMAHQISSNPLHTAMYITFVLLCQLLRQVTV